MVDKCDVCGAPATQFACDIACTTNLATDTIHNWEPAGRKYGCDAHPPESTTHDRTFFGFQFKYSRYEIHPSSRKVRTILNLTGLNGLQFICEGERDPCNWNNIREAKSEGYLFPDPAECVWHSLVEHELLHSLVAEVLFDRSSRVMLTESGAEFTPLWERYEEEMLCLAIQAHLNGQFPPCLSRYSDIAVATITARMLVQYRPLMWSRSKDYLRTINK